MNREFKIEVTEDLVQLISCDENEESVVTEFKFDTEDYFDFLDQYDKCCKAKIYNERNSAYRKFY